MMTMLVAFLAVHGLIHLMGFAKAFGYADLPALTMPITYFFGALWLGAACLFLAAAVAVVAWPRGWWVIGAAALTLSMVVIVPSWHDAKFGALANGIVLVAVVFGALAFGPTSLHADYSRDVRAALGHTAPQELVTEQDLAHLPSPVQRYLRVTGAVGQPRVRNFRVTMHGRIRSAPDTAWMPFTAEQYNTVDEPARMFYMTATRAMLPVQGYHRFVGPTASMHIKAAALVPVASISGSVMDVSETVTMFNDMCVMAPATLIEPSVQWEAVDERTAKARFTHAGRTVGAELSFDEQGVLTNFWSDDRYATSTDGAHMKQLRWSTPLRAYRQFGSARLASVGEGRWHESNGSWAYIELTLDSVQYNVRGR